MNELVPITWEKHREAQIFGWLTAAVRAGVNLPTPPSPPPPPQGRAGPHKAQGLFHGPRLGGGGGGDLSGSSIGGQRDASWGETFGGASLRARRVKTTQRFWMSSVPLNHLRRTHVYLFCTLPPPPPPPLLLFVSPATPSPVSSPPPFLHTSIKWPCATTAINPGFVRAPRRRRRGLELQMEMSQ